MKRGFLILLLISTSIGCFGQDVDSLNTLYHVFANSSGKDRILVGQDIVQWLVTEDFITDTLISNSLPEKEFEIKVLDLTTRYLFRFEFNASTLEAASELVRLSEAASNTPTLIVGYYFMGFANQRMGNMDKGLLYAQKCYELCLSAQDEEMTSSVLNNIGNIYMINGQDSMAVVYFRKTLEIERQLGRKANQAIRLGNMATAYKKLNMLDEALASALEGIELDLLSERPDKLAIRYHQAGDVYTEMGNYEKAKEYELKALEYFKATNSTYGQAIILDAMGTLENRQQNYSSAIRYFNQALSFAESIQNKLLIQRICHNLYNLNREKNPALSLVYLERDIALKDSIFHVENQKQINEFQVRYETAEKELEIERQQAEIGQYRANRTILIVSLSLSALILVLLWTMLGLRTRRARLLAEMNATKDKFFSIISHDLKNPAIAQRDAIQTLFENVGLWDNQALKNYYQSMLRSADNQVDLLYNLLNWAQVQTGRMPYTPALFDLVACLRTDLALLQNLADRKGIDLQVHFPEKAFVTGDSDMVATVVRNLATNAIKFTGTCGKVTLDITDHTVSVSDTGMGMTDEERLTLFTIDRQQTHTGTAGEQSSGLGLMVCRELLQKHGATLQVESQKGIGSRFWFTM